MKIFIISSANDDNFMVSTFLTRNPHIFTNIVLFLEFLRIELLGNKCRATVIKPTEYQLIMGFP